MFISPKAQNSVKIVFFSLRCYFFIAFLSTVLTACFYLPLGLNIFFPVYIRSSTIFWFFLLYILSNYLHAFVFSLSFFFSPFSCISLIAILPSMVGTKSGSSLSWSVWNGSVADEDLVSSSVSESILTFSFSFFCVPNKLLFDLCKISRYEKLRTANYSWCFN